MDSNHLFWDGYNVSQTRAEDVSVMLDLLTDVNEIVFGDAGETMIIPVFTTEKPINDGVSGLILAEGGHFTCHTFSRRGVAFIDLYAAWCYDEDLIEGLVYQHLGPVYVQHCGESTREGFGRHAVLRIPAQTMEVSEQLVENLVTGIGMTKLARSMTSASAEGCDVIQPITESHIALHNYAEGAMLDVFSCKDFSTEALMSVLADFDILPSEMAMISRGTDMTNKQL